MNWGQLGTVTQSLEFFRGLTQPKPDFPKLRITPCPQFVNHHLDFISLL